MHVVHVRIEPQAAPRSLPAPCTPTPCSRSLCNRTGHTYALLLYDKFRDPPQHLQHLHAFDLSQVLRAACPLFVPSWTSLLNCSTRWRFFDIRPYLSYPISDIGIFRPSYSRDQFAQCLGSWTIKSRSYHEQLVSSSSALLELAKARKQSDC